mgnify:CR=1 FL=1
MEKFSVKKPFTVLVAVIMVLMLGFVSITKMKTNLLPNVSTPYLMVVTVYPGACGDRGLGRAAKRAYGAGCFKDHRHLG